MGSPFVSLFLFLLRHQDPRQVASGVEWSLRRRVRPRAVPSAAVPEKEWVSGKETVNFSFVWIKDL